MSGIAIEGTDKLRKKLKVASKGVDTRFTQALYIGGLFLQRQSQEIVPIDTGNLRGSAFTRPESDAPKPTVKVGYTASYAVYVHEDKNARHEEGKMAKFLEIPLRLYRSRIVQLVRKKMKGLV